MKASGQTDMQWIASLLASMANAVFQNRLQHKLGNQQLLHAVIQRNIP